MNGKLKQKRLSQNNFKILARCMKQITSEKSVKISGELLLLPRWLPLTTDAAKVSFRLCPAKHTYRNKICVFYVSSICLLFVFYLSSRLGKWIVTCMKSIYYLSLLGLIGLPVQQRRSNRTCKMQPRESNIAGIIVKILLLDHAFCFTMLSVTITVPDFLVVGITVPDFSTRKS